METTHQQLLRELECNGYVILKNVLPPEQCRALKETLEALMFESLEANRTERFFRVICGHNRHDLRVPPNEIVQRHIATITQQFAPVYLELFTRDGILTELGAITSLPGAEQQRVHSDVVFGEGRNRIFTTFVSLQDIDDSMGPTCIWPGTHTARFHKLERPQVPNLSLVPVLAQSNSNSKDLAESSTSSTCSATGNAHGTKNNDNASICGADVLSGRDEASSCMDSNGKSEKCGKNGSESVLNSKYNNIKNIDADYLGDQYEDSAVLQRARAFYNQLPSVKLSIPIGDAILMDSRVMHCGGANVSNQSRMLFHFSFVTTEFSTPDTDEKQELDPFGFSYHQFEFKQKHFLGKFLDYELK